MEPHQADREFVLDEGDVNHAGHIFILVVAVLDIGEVTFHPAVHFAGVGLVGNDAQGARLGRVAKQCALGSTQGFKSLDID